MSKFPFWLARNHMAAKGATCQGCGAAHPHLEPTTLHYLKQRLDDSVGMRVRYRVGVRCNDCRHELVWAGEGTVSEMLARIIEEDPCQNS